MDGVKKLKRGEVLFKEGDQTSSIYIIQSGKVSLMLERGGKKIEITQLGTSQVLGEGAIFGNPRSLFSAEAASETKVLEIAVDVMKLQFEKAMPGMKLLLKSMFEESKVARNIMKNSKLEGDKSPLPHALIPRTFTMLQVVARHIAKRNNAENPNELDLNWGIYRQYVSRFFGESQARYRSLFDLLAKLQLATLKIEKNEEGQEELGWIKIHSIQAIEDFAEFFQYHLMKGAKAEAIHVDPLALKAAKAFVAVSGDAPVNHKGASTIDYNALLNECKTKFKFDLKNTHLDILEKKGLFCKRKTLDDGKATIEFDRPEFVKMADYWSIIWEIEKWNAKGHVEMVDKEEGAVETGLSCGACQAQLTEQMKFCPACGAKVASAA